jgi:serine O-acetyltransferase
VLAALRADRARLAENSPHGEPWRTLSALVLDAGFQAVVLYRLANGLRRNRVPLAGPLLSRFSLFLTGAEISPAAVIGPGLRIGHAAGIVIGGGARIGARAFLLQQVTVGARSQARIAEMPEVGDDVFLGAGARVLGGIRVGNGAVIGANAVVVRDVPDGAKVLAPESSVS